METNTLRIISPNEYSNADLCQSIRLHILNKLNVLLAKQSRAALFCTVLITAQNETTAGPPRHAKHIQLASLGSRW